jgi:Lon protease-like protein
VDKDFATAKPEHQAAYLAYVTKEKAEGPKADAQEPEEAPEPISKLNKKLMNALSLSPASQEALTKANLGNAVLTKMLSRLTRKQLELLGSEPSRPRRRILKDAPVEPRSKRRL